MKTIKIKVGREPGRDVEVIKAVRNAAGPEVEIRADANQGYKMPDALRFLKGVAEEQLQYIEQALAAGDWKVWLFCAGKAYSHCSGRESLWPGRRTQYHSPQCGRRIHHKIDQTGRCSSGQEGDRMAEAAGVPCVAVSPYETSLG